VLQIKPHAHTHCNNHQTTLQRHTSLDNQNFHSLLCLGQSGKEHTAAGKPLHIVLSGEAYNQLLEHIKAFCTWERRPTELAARLDQRQIRPFITDSSDVQLTEILRHAFEVGLQLLRLDKSALYSGTLVCIYLAHFVPHLGAVVEPACLFIPVPLKGLVASCWVT